MVGDGAGDGGPRARARCEAGLLRGSVATTTLSGTGASPRLLEEKPDGQVQAGFVSPAGVLSPAPALVLYPRGAQTKATAVGTRLGSRMGVGAWPQAVPQAASAALPAVSVRTAASACSDASSGLSCLGALLPSSLFGHSSPLHRNGGSAASGSKRIQSGRSAQARAHVKVVVGSSPAHPEFQSILSALFWE